MNIDDRPRKPGRVPAAVQDGAIAAVVAGAGIAAVAVDASGPVGRGAAYTGAMIGLAFAQSLPLLWRRTKPVPVAAIITAAFLAYNPLSAPVQPLGLIVAVYSVGAYAPRKASLATIAAGAPAAIGYLAFRAGENSPTRTSDVVTFAAAILVAWAIGNAVGARRAYTRALEERALLVEARREENARRAVAEERARIARELHDVVAHHVSTMVVQAGGAGRVAATDAARTKEALAEIEDAGRRALAEMRRMLGVLRDDGEARPLAPQPGVAALGDLVATTRSAGLDVELRIDGVQHPLPAGADLSVYRIVQEALTNVIKHAGKTRAFVRVRFTPSEVSVEVSDEGTGRAGDPVNGEGHGLLGMRERVSMFGGDLQAGPRVGGGFTVRARIPVEEATP